MEDRNPSTPSLSLSACRVRRHAAEEEDGGDPGACTGKSCQSCTAVAIADCVAVCCCPCAVVNIFVLLFFKLPWAAARRCLRARRKRRRRRRMLEERKCRGTDRDGISAKERAVDGTSGIEMGPTGEELNVNFSPEEVWLELYEVGHLGFGRVSFTGITFHNKGN